MIKISTWNVNSINARLENLLNYLHEEQPDILLLQELKCTNDKFPHQPLEDLGYNIAVNGQKTYNGVAILSKYQFSDVAYNFPNNPIPNESRYIEAWVNFKNESIKVASVYVPNGQSLDSDKYPIKLEFLKQLENYYHKLLLSSEKILIGGDFNVALTELDMFDPEGFEETILVSSKERKALRQFIATGLVDSYRMTHHQEKDNCYTWWDYRANSFNLNKGMRIDYLFCSLEMAQTASNSFTSKKCRADLKPSDHIPVTGVFNLSK